MFLQACKVSPLYLRLSNKGWEWVPCKHSVCCVCESLYNLFEVFPTVCVCGVG